MTATLTGLVAGALSTAGLGSLNLSRDEAKSQDTAAMPYAVLREGISTAPTASSGRDFTRVTELVQLDLFQNRKAGPDDSTLMPRIRAAIDAMAPAVTTGSHVVQAVRFLAQQSVRRYDPETRIVTESLTIRVTRTV